MAKKLQKIFALLLAASMTMSLMSVSALAEEPEDSGTGHPHNPITCETCKGSGHKLAECETCQGSGTILVQGTCSECNGTGTVTEEVDCETCGGDGELDDGSSCTECGGGGFFIETVTCPVCNGTCVTDQEEECPDCKGTGEVQTEELCPDCTDGKIPCTSDRFDKSELTKVAYDQDKAIAGGTMTYTCSVCGATYEEELDAQTVLEMMAQNLSVGEYKVSSATANAGQKLTYSLKITNNNSDNLPNIEVHVQFPEGLTFTNYNTRNLVYYSGSYKGSVVPVYNVASAAYDEESRVLTMTIPGIVAGKSLQATFYATVDETVELGSDLNAELSVMVGGQPADDLSDSVSTHVNKYTGTKNIYLTGAYMAGWYNPENHSYLTTATTSKTNKNTSLDALEGAEFSFSGAFDTEQNPTTGFIRYDPEYYGEIIENPYDLRVWQCVGFVPYKGYSGNTDLEVLASYVYAEDEENQEGFTKGSLEDAVAFVKEQKGVLYGQTATEENIQAFADQVYNGYVSIMTVWYVSEKEPLQKGEYGELTIDPVSPVNYRTTSSGAKISYGDVTYDSSKGFAVADVTITITGEAAENININLNDALAGIMEEINEADGPNSVQPGDVMTYLNIKVDDQSGRDYQYVDDSLKIGTIPMTGDGSMGVGFDGYTIPLPITIDGKEYSYIPRRILNRALADLGVSKDLSDEAIGALLAKEGYGAGENLTNAEITQTYLGDYYLDYLNQFRTEDNQAKDFQDLTVNELSTLTNGDSSGVNETCQEVAEALYYFYYGGIYTFWGSTADAEGDQTVTTEKSLYDWMANGRELGTAFGKAINSAEPFTLGSMVNGAFMNNAFQNTLFGFGMQFQMAASNNDDDDDDDDDDGDKPSNPGTDIPEEDTPTTDLPDVPGDTPSTDIPDEDTPTTDIPEEDTPMAEVPKTGDLSALWLALTGLSGSGLAAVTVLGRKKRDEE